ncbi:MAG TPA: tungstate ABC transporter substrate-binding protein WtpA [Chloroflexi bacterium]|nr:tungstate ABC transporter substrate-binding protein WtpA [Chloroflexota bacterium]
MAGKQTDVRSSMDRHPFIPRWMPVFATTFVAVLILTSGCSNPAQTTPQSAENVGVEGKLTIFHAGSLTVPVEKLTAAFQAQHPSVTFETEAAGSRTTARKISELGRQADVVMSADYTVIDNLLIPDFASWNIQFARNQMVIAYTDQSQFADEINSENWYEILTSDGVVYGHSDPNADPCGYRTLLVWQLAEVHYGVPKLYEALVEHCPPENVRPKETDLIALLQSGDMDYAFEYRSIAAQHGLKFVELPDEINLSQVEYAEFYSQAAVEVSGAEPGTTITKTGKPIVYGVTIPNNAPSLELALEFVKFLLSPQGQVIMEAQGQPPIVPPVAVDKNALPVELWPLVK